MQARKNNGRVGGPDMLTLQALALNVNVYLGGLYLNGQFNKQVTTDKIMAWFGANGITSVQQIYDRMPDSTKQGILTCTFTDASVSPQTEQDCWTNIRTQITQFVSEQYMAWAANPPLCIQCKKQRRQCGDAAAEGECPAQHCGDCPQGQTCSNGKCVKNVNFSQDNRDNNFVAVVSNTSPSKQPAPVSFPAQPYMQVLLESMSDQLSVNTQIPVASKTYKSIADWITAHGWKDIGAVFAAFNLPQSNSNFAPLVTQSVAAFGQDYIQQGQESPRPTTETTSSPWPWIVGIGVLGALGIVVYHVTRTPHA